jgi:zinc transporter 1
MISDLLSLIVGFFSLMVLNQPNKLTIIKVAKRVKNRKYSYGWIRAEPIGALVNGVFLLSLSFYIIIESFQRFVTPPGIFW